MMVSTIVSQLTRHYIFVQGAYTESKNQGHSRRSGWSGFSRTTISLGKNKISFYRKQVTNKCTRVVFGLVQLIIIMIQ